MTSATVIGLLLIINSVEIFLERFSLLPVSSHY